MKSKFFKHSKENHAHSFGEKKIHHNYLSFLWICYSRYSQKGINHLQYLEQNGLERKTPLIYILLLKAYFFHLQNREIPNKVYDKVKQMPYFCIIMYHRFGSKINVSSVKWYHINPPPLSLSLSHTHTHKHTLTNIHSFDSFAPSHITQDST